MATRRRKPPVVFKDSKIELNFDGEKTLELEVGADGKITVRLGPGFSGADVWIESQKGSPIPAGTCMRIRRRISSLLVSVQVDDAWWGQDVDPVLELSFDEGFATATASVANLDTEGCLRKDEPARISTKLQKIRMEA